MFVYVVKVEEETCYSFYKVYYFYIIPIITQRRQIEVVRIDPKVDKVVIVPYISFFCKLSVYMWTKNMNEKYDFFSPQVFLNISPLLFFQPTEQ